MFATRLISGIILVALALLIVGSGGLWLFAASAGISCVGLFELYRVMKMEDKLPGVAGIWGGAGLLWPGVV